MFNHKELFRSPVSRADPIWVIHTLIAIFLFVIKVVFKCSKDKVHNTQAEINNQCVLWGLCVTVFYSDL